MNYWTQSKDNIFVAAHRGWKAKYPENTLEAFKAALDVGVDQLEMTDVIIGLFCGIIRHFSKIMHKL